MIDLNLYTWLRIEPTDAWFFRDGRPSNRGEDQSDIESEFPPNSATVVGALRAALARANGWSGRGSWANEGEELKQVLGDGFDNLGKLSFLGPFLCRRFPPNGSAAREELLWPLPRHVVGRFVDDKFVPEAMMQPSSELVCCDANVDGIPLPEVVLDEAAAVSTAATRKPPSHPENVYVTTSGLNAILAGRPPASDDCVLAGELYRHEARVGIRRDSETRTTGSGDMYSPRYVRLMPGVSLVHAVAGVPESWEWPTVMPLGGESRLATVDRLDSSPPFPAVDRCDAAIAIALAPARFESTWWGAGPGDPAAQLSATLTGRVKCAALDRPRLIGGWDYRNGPRALAPFAPPGTVWWLDDHIASKARLMQFGTSLPYGYGLAVVTGTANEDTQ